MDTLGKFIVFEGLDGCGKSTQAELLKTHLERERRVVLLTKEPTAESEAGKKIRRVLSGEITLPPAELQELFAEDRAFHVDKIIQPARMRGEAVISDRYFFSSFAFGAGADGLDLKWLIQINSGFFMPDLTFILAVSPEACLERMKARGEKAALFEKLEKLRRTWEVYKSFPEKFRNVHMIDGERPIEVVAEEIVRTTEALFH